jgi:hypothetical protein
MRTLIGGIAPSSWTRDLERRGLDDFVCLGGFSLGASALGLMLGGLVVKGRPILEPGLEPCVVAVVVAVIGAGAK